MIDLKTDAEIAAMTRAEMEAYAVVLFMELTPEERRELLAELYERYPEKKKAAPVLPTPRRPKSRTTTT